MDGQSRNIEIKAKVLQPLDIVYKAKILSNSSGTIFSQVDTFFNVAHGRLKLRKEGDLSTLIYYDRPDAEGPKLCKYNKCSISDGQGLETALSAALGVKGTVKKIRHLFLIGQTRVHVDKVEGLGDFMELEVVLNERETTEDGQIIAANLMKELGVDKEHLISCAYMDLLLNK